MRSLHTLEAMALILQMVLKIRIMNKKELEKYCKKHLVPYLENKGFKWKGFEITSYEFSKIVGKDRFTGHSNYFKKPYGLSLSLPTYTLFLDKFEELFYSLRDKYDMGSNQATLGIYDVNSEELALRQKVGNYTINSEESFLLWMEGFIEYFENYVEPWFEKYTHLEAINELINQLDSEAKWHQDWGISYQAKLIIFRICKNPGYKEYAEWYKQYHEQIREKEKSELLYCNYALELLEQCENGAFDEFKL